MSTPLPRPLLITGAAGFIGSRLALLLRSDGLPVRGLVRPEHDVRELEAAGVRVVRGDAADPEAVAAAAAGCGVIFHLAAARGHLKLGYRGYRALNRGLSEAVAEAALRTGVERVVVASTASVTGNSGSTAQTEDTPPRPNSAYRSSRLEDERLFEEYASRRGLDVVIARVPQRVLGPGTRGWTKVARAVRDGAFRILPSGGSIHSGDVDDVVDGLRLCALADGAGVRRFQFGAEAPMATLSVLRAIADELGVPFAPHIAPAAPFRTYVALGNLTYRWARVSLPYHFTAEFYSARIALDIGRAREQLGYSPRFGLRESIARTVRWLKEQGLV